MTLDMVCAGVSAAGASVADMPKVAVASSMMTCLGGFMLVDSYLRNGPIVAAAGAVVGGTLLWQAWWLLMRGAAKKDTSHKELDLEGGLKQPTDSVSLRVFSTELPPAVNGCGAATACESECSLMTCV